MMIFFCVFIFVSFALIPVAWIVGINDKMNVTTTNYSHLDKMCNYLFIPFGPIILLFDVVSDLYYFWTNSFRTDLK